jgi:hypothetical protein
MKLSECREEKEMLDWDNEEKGWRKVREGSWQLNHVAEREDQVICVIDLKSTWAIKSFGWVMWN